jgi:hypothetical protein
MPEQLTTPKARDRRAWNSEKHGLTGQIHLVNQTEQSAYDAHTRDLHEALSPQGPLETNLTQQISDDRWRLQRASSLESAIFADGQILHAEEPASDNPEVDAALAQGRTWLAESRNIALLSLYESRIQRRFEKNMAQLKELQSERKAALQQTIEEAAILTQLAETQGQTFDLVEHFRHRSFAFSSQELAAMVNRHNRLQEAKKLFATTRKPLRMAA